MTENTFPFPDRPGVPLNPEKEGWHWVKTGHGLAPWLWRDDPQSIMWAMGWETNEEVFAPGDIARVPGTTYLGPCLTPEEVRAKDARIAELEAALQRIASAGGLFAEPASGQHAREIARAALGGKDESSKD